MNRKVSQKILDKFLAVLRETGNVQYSCTAATLDRTSAYWIRKRNPEFKAKWDQALEEGEEIRLALAEQELRRRAIDGVDEPKFHLGRVCGHIRKYSDLLLIFHLKALNPQKYAEHVKQLTPETDHTKLTDAEIDRLAEERRKARTAAAKGITTEGSHHAN